MAAIVAPPATVTDVPPFNVTELMVRESVNVCCASLAPCVAVR